MLAAPLLRPPRASTSSRPRPSRPCLSNAADRKNMFQLAYSVDTIGGNTVLHGAMLATDYLGELGGQAWG